ncbi:MAG: AraC family transcriptional regulator [Porphyromonadaceae bacterium]|nr:MAG: AraC family transcriptional regulator [Porphyromonadaceae bacterium]
MTKIRHLIERSRRGIKFTGNSQTRIGNFIKEIFNKEGVPKIVNLLMLLEMMTDTDEYELLSSIGFVESVNSADFERFNKVYQYLVNNFTSPIKLDQVADLVGLTPTAFCRYFKERTQKTFVQYLNDLRIGRARRLLIEGKMKISTISMEVGFNNYSNFIEQFKKSSNMSPSTYQDMFRLQAQDVI